MSDNTIPIVEPTIDYTKVPPIHQKRTVSFINHFIVTTVSFLNKFALTCEEKLYDFENKLQKLEAAVVILESRLSSIPGLDVKSPDKDCEKKENETVDNNNPEKTTNTNQDVNVSGHDEADINEPEPESTQAQVQNQPSDDLEPICTHPVYRKYFKMLHVGVVKHAVKLKMAQEGLDPSLLDDPQHLIPKISDTPE
ncbi:WASH complex subunit 3 [Microplitis demolitor]|uniref:WASH complex subunit 3 n=1 Tax=Microplitis demolitor TaxID=69319 RepID=UPI0004CCEA36|nr:WASH complex subunit 3 [Microplitis demolitor]